jgi:hypothetical protein
LNSLHNNQPNINRTNNNQLKIPGIGVFYSCHDINFYNAYNGENIQFSIGLFDSSSTSNSTPTASSADNSTPTASADNSTPTASADNSTPTASADNLTPTASADNSTPTASSDNSTPTASADNSAPTASADNSSPTASADNSTPTASADKSTPTASSDNSTPTASADNSTPTASADNSAPTASADNSSPTASADNSTPTASADNSTPTASADNSTPTASADNSITKMSNNLPYCLFKIKICAQEYDFKYACYDSSNPFYLPSIKINSENLSNNFSFNKTQYICIKNNIKYRILFYVVKPSDSNFFILVPLHMFKLDFFIFKKIVFVKFLNQNIFTYGKRYTIYYSKLIIDNKSIIYNPSIVLGNRHYSSEVYFYAIYLYLSNFNYSQRLVAKKVKEKFNLVTFSHSIISRLLPKLVIHEIEKIEQLILDKYYEKYIVEKLDLFSIKRNMAKLKYLTLIYQWPPISESGINRYCIDEINISKIPYLAYLFYYYIQHI